MRFLMHVLTGLLPAMPVAAQDTVMAQRVLSEINKAFYGQEQTGYHIRYAYFVDCLDREPAETDDGLLVKNNGLVYGKQFGEERIITSGLSVLIDHDFGTIRLREREAAEVNSGDLFGSWLAMMARRLSDTSLEALDGGRERLSLHTETGDVEVLSITYHSGSKQIERVSIVFRSGNFYDFPAGACMKLRYQPIPAAEVGNYATPQALQKYVRKDRQGSWTVTEAYKDYHLITPSTIGQ